MENSKKLKIEFTEAKDKLYSNAELLKDGYKFSLEYSLLVEEYIIKLIQGEQFNFALASGGSFSRRELSPYSDIDLMFICVDSEKGGEEIGRLTTLLWDNGIEASHTVREFSDIKRFLKEDLHAFTQFFETRFLYGSRKLYDDWNKELFNSLTEKNKKSLIQQFFGDIAHRHNKYGDSPKVLEPNIKFTAGCLRDLQVVEWMFSLKNQVLFTEYSELTQTETFLNIFLERKLINPREIKRLFESYEFLLRVRNYLHLYNNRKNDRLEFAAQEKIAPNFGYAQDTWQTFMQEFFNHTSIIYRFSRTLLKRYEEEISKPISDFLAIDLDEEFIIKDDIISVKYNKILSLSGILRAFYYRGKHQARFDENLRSLIIESVHEFEDKKIDEMESSVFFREIMRLPHNVARTLYVMNELGVLGAYMEEWKELVGFFQPGVYHCYTADEHTLVAMLNIEKLAVEKGELGKLYNNLKNRDILFLAVLFHDIAKPISISGHEIIGAEIAVKVMEQLGYSQRDIEVVQFLVRHHLTMEQIAFRRNLNDPATLNNFASLFDSTFKLDLLYILTYADLSAVSPVVWTQWKSDLLNELYRKTKVMLLERVSGEELLYSDTRETRESLQKSDDSIKSHIEAMDDLQYLQNFSDDEIALHVEEIEKGLDFSVFFKQNSENTNVTIMTKDTSYLLSRLCGALAINDLNIHDAKIFTREDNFIIDSFNVTDYRTNKPISEERYIKIEENIRLALQNELEISSEFERLKSKWRRFENRLFKRKSKVKVMFELHNNYTIIDVYSPDTIGLLYTITKKMNELGIVTYFAKIATQADDVVDAFYTLYENGQKISPNDFELIKKELTEAIQELF